MYQCRREERLSLDAMKNTSGITEGECISDLGKKSSPYIPGNQELQRENVSVSLGRKVVLKC